MLRLLILTSLCAVVSASIPPDNPIALQRLFGAKREAVSQENKSQREVCETEECKAIAKIIKGSIDESVDPCDDFFEYACRNWAQANPPPENVTRWSFIHMLKRKIDQQVENITTDKIQPDDPHVVKLAKKWYHSCVNIENIEKRGVEPILSTLWRHGGWPLIMEEGEWDDNMYYWQVVDDHYARLFGRNAFYGVDFNYHLYFTTGEDSGVIKTPQLPQRIKRLLPKPKFYDMKFDDSDENNESGAGSQEAGSREKTEENKQNENEGNEEENEFDSGSDTIEDDGDEELRKRKIKLSAKRLNHKRLRQRHNIKSKHIKKMQKRNKRGVGEHEILRQLLNQLKAKKHKVHHRAIGKHEHAAHNKLKHILNKKHSNKNKIGETEDKEFHKNKIFKNLKHGKGENHKNKALGKHAKKSKRTETNIHTSVHHKQQKMANHRVHHAVNKISVSKRRLISDAAESSNNVGNSGNDDENSDQDEQEDSEKENESNEENDDDGDDNNTEENEETDDEGDNNDETNEDEKEEEEDEEEEIQKAKEEYRDYILNVSLILSKGRGIEIPKEQMLQDIDDLIEFAIKLALIAVSKYEYIFIDNEENVLENTTLAELQQFYENLGPITRNNKIKWVTKVQKLFSEAGVEIDDDVPFETDAEYITALHTLLKETPARVLVNYVHWNFLDFAISASTKELHDLYEQWNGKSYGSREYMCASLTEKTTLIKYQYVQKYFKEETIKAAKDMLDDIQKEVEYLIKGSEWMDEETKHFVLDKIVYMKSWDVYPEWYRNTTLVKRYFQGISLGPSFYENILNYKRFKKFRDLRLIQGKDQTLFDQTMNPTEVNAFFIPSENSLSFSAADLQSPLFAYNRPWYLNFALFGSIISHEVNHGFDNRGHLYDKRGDRLEWSTAMADAYNKRVMCFVDQYNNYEIIRGENFTIENYGLQTIGDNIADSMGVHTVFRAYKRRLRECGEEDPALPGLEQFSNEQSFFLSYANLWCEVVDVEGFKKNSTNDNHSSHRLRAIGPLSNSKEFAKAFKCPLGSPMNPEKKCNIWE